MALGENVTWECRADGDNANGGGYYQGAGGIDRSQQAAAHATLTTASVIHSTTTQLNVSAGDYTVTSDDVGNIIFITGGSATAGRYRVTAVDVGNNRWTMDRSMGTAGQTCPGKFGGGLATPLYACANAWVGGNTIWLRKDAGTFLHTATWLTGNTASNWTGSTRGNRILGYNTTRGDIPTGTDRPLVQQSTNSSMISLQLNNGADSIVENIRFDGNALTLSNGIYMGSVGRFYNCYVTNTKQYGIYGDTGASALFIDCEVDALASGATAGITMAVQTAIGCWVHDNPCTGFSLSGNSGAIRCLSTNNTGASSDGFGMYRPAFAIQCTAHGNGRHGFRLTDINYVNAIRGCLATSNGGYGLQSVDLFPKSPFVDYNAFWNNTSGETSGFSDTGGSHTSGDYTTHNVTLGGDPYVDAGSDDYTPNAGDGFELWGASFTPFIDIGARQHNPDDAPVSGGGMPIHPGMTGNLNG